MPSFALSRISFLFLVLTLNLSGCVFIDQFMASLKQSSLASSTNGMERTEGDRLVVESLLFAEQVAQMPQEEREKTASSLAAQIEEDISPQDRLASAILTLYVEENILPPDVVLSRLDYFDSPVRDHSPLLDGLVASLRQALANLIQTKATLYGAEEQLIAEKRKVQSTTEELEAEKKKTTEMAQKLQKLLEIEKIMEQRK